MKAGGEAMYRRVDGIVMIDPEKAKGRRDIMDACPYGAIYWNDDFDIPQKCTFCAHLLDSGWTQTRCSQICATGATTFLLVEPGDMKRKCEEEGLLRYRDDLGTKPRVYYKNLYRFTKHFISGSLILDGECCEGAHITVEGDGVKAEGASDGFGDFRVDSLDPGTYKVIIQYPGRSDVERSVTLTTSCNLGEINV